MTVVATQTWTVSSGLSEVSSVGKSIFGPWRVGRYTNDVLRYHSRLHGGFLYLDWDSLWLTGAYANIWPHKQQKKPGFVCDNVSVMGAHDNEFVTMHRKYISKQLWFFNLSHILSHDQPFYSHPKRHFAQSALSRKRWDKIVLSHSGFVCAQTIRSNITRRGVTGVVRNSVFKLVPEKNKITRDSNCRCRISDHDTGVVDFTCPDSIKTTDTNNTSINSFSLLISINLTSYCLFYLTSEVYLFIVVINYPFTPTLSYSTSCHASVSLLTQENGVVLLCVLNRLMVITQTS